MSKTTYNLRPLQDAALAIFKKFAQICIKTVEPHTTTLMYKMGRKIYFSKGNQTNIKITTKEDLELFSGWVRQKGTYA